MNLFLENFILNNSGKLPLIVCEDIEAISNEEWLDLRRTGIGGSDAGTVYYGDSPFKTASDIARSKLSDEKEEVTAEKQFMFDYGHALEASILKYIGKKMGAMTFTDRAMFRHPDYQYMLADCDGFGIMPDGEVVGFEIKTTNAYNIKEWRSGVWGEDAICPIDSYIIQMLHYMIVLGLKTYYLVVCFNNNASDICVIRLDYNEAMAQSLIQKEKEFWDNKEVIAALPPKSCSKEKAKRYVDYCKKNSVTFENADCQKLAGEILDLQEQQAQLKSKLSAIEKQIEAKKTPILATMGDEKIVNFGDIQCIIKTTKRNSWDTKLLNEHPELAALYKKQTESSKLEISIIQE